MRIDTRPKYKFKNDFINGVLPNSGGKPNILFKKGDIINGIVTEKFVFNANTKGINAKPTVVGARVENADGLVFVPLQNVEIITNLSDNVGVGQVKQTFSKKNNNSLILVGVPIGFYVFSKYQKYDSKKTLKVTIIGSVVVLGAIILNGFSGAFSGTSIMDRTFGKQKYW